MCGTLSALPRASTSQREVAAETSSPVSSTGGGLFVFQSSRFAQRGRRRAEADDPDDVLETPPPGPLLGPAEEERLEAETPTDDKGADTRRPPELVRA